MAVSSKQTSRIYKPTQHIDDMVVVAAAPPTPQGFGFHAVHVDSGVGGVGAMTAHMNHKT